MNPAPRTFQIWTSQQQVTRHPSHLDVQKMPGYPANSDSDLTRVLGLPRKTGGFSCAAGQRHPERATDFLRRHPDEDLLQASNSNRRSSILSPPRSLVRSRGTEPQPISSFLQAYSSFHVCAQPRAFRPLVGKLAFRTGIGYSSTLPVTVFMGRAEGFNPR